jgi:probable HAF family extracellular repeat protein
MNMMIRSIRSTLGKAIVLCAFALTLVGDTSAVFGRQESVGAEHRKPDPSQYTFTQIDFPGAFVTAVSGINDRGQFTGAYIDAGGTQHGFLLDDGVFTTIDFPGSADFNIARGINDRGQIVGTFFDAQEITRSYLLDDGIFTLLDIPGENGDTANGINNRGQIVGTFFDTADLPHGILFDKGAFTQFEPPGATASVPSAINDHGQIVGFFADAGALVHGFFFDDSVFTRIDFPGTPPVTAAQGVNNRGQIVGAFGISFQQLHGFLLDDGAYTQIDFPGSILTSLFGINNRGQIVGRFAGADATPHSFLATKEQFNGKAGGVGSGEEKAELEIVGTFTSPTDLDLSTATLSITSLLNERAGGGELVSGFPLVLTAVPESRRNVARFVDRSRPNLASVTIHDAGPGKFNFKIKVSAAIIGSLQNCSPTRFTTSFRLDAAKNPPIVVSTERSWVCSGPSNGSLKTP